MGPAAHRFCRPNVVTMSGTRPIKAARCLFENPSCFPTQEHLELDLERSKRRLLGSPQFA